MDVNKNYVNEEILICDIYFCVVSISMKPHSYIIWSYVHNRQQHITNQ